MKGMAASAVSIIYSGLQLVYGLCFSFNGRVMMSYINWCSVDKTGRVIGTLCREFWILPIRHSPMGISKFRAVFDSVFFIILPQKISALCGTVHERD